MKIRLMFFFFGIIFLMGCTDMVVEAPTATATNIVLPVDTPLVLPTRTASPFPTLASIPTYENQTAYSLLLELIQGNAGCSFPCLWGITPGISTTEEAYSILFPFTGIAKVSQFPLASPGYIDIEYLVGTQKVFAILDYSPDCDTHIIKALHLRTAATRIVSDPATQDSSDYGSGLYREVFDVYLLSHILSTYGIPDDVLIMIEPGLEAGAIDFFHLRLLYLKKGIFLGYGTPAEEDEMNYWGCPSKMIVSLYMLSSEYRENYWDVLITFGADDWINFYGSPTISKSLEEATNMSLEEFYEKYSVSTNECIETPKNIWNLP